MLRAGRTTTGQATGAAGGARAMGLPAGDGRAPHFLSALLIIDSSLSLFPSFGLAGWPFLRFTSRRACPPDTPQFQQKVLGVPGSLLAGRDWYMKSRGFRLVPLSFEIIDGDPKGYRGSPKGYTRAISGKRYNLTGSTQEPLKQGFQRSSYQAATGLGFRV